MSLLFETIRIENGVPQHLQWHRQRMERSGLSDAALVLKIPDEMRNGTVKCNVVYDSGIREITFSCYERRIIRSLRLIETEYFDYRLKYRDRTFLDRLFEQRGECDDIIIVINGRVTDSSRANIIFYDGSRWITPSMPLLEGTCRARLLSEGKISEEDICISDLKNYSGCKLINAMNWPGEGEVIMSSALTL